MKSVTLFAFAALLLSACAEPSPDELGASAADLTAAQCSAFDVNGKVQICHRTSSTTHPYTIIRVSEAACISGHAAHDGDYVTSPDPSSPLYDPTCQGLGCLPETAPCDATLPCCDGLTCQAGTCVAVEVDECASDPCVNGECIDGDGSYTCACLPGWTGTNCEIDIDECGHAPCVHGVCVDEINAYTCDCEPGYTGANCELDIDECANNPCDVLGFGLGTCHDQVAGYTCECSPFASGENCEIVCPCILAAVQANDIDTAITWAYTLIGLFPGTACFDDGAGTTSVGVLEGYSLTLTPTSCHSTLPPLEGPSYPVTTPEEQALCRNILDAGIARGGLTCSASSPCDAVTCENGGTCAVFGAFGLCECVDGYTGNNCEIAP